MKTFQINPTIKETNKYLNRAVDELLKKHGNVSSPDFEKELIAVTGIGWKQVKNYKNHPKPRQRLKDNSIVVKYVRRCRQKDTWRKVRLSLISATVLATVAWVSFWYITKTNEVEKFVIHEFPPTPPQDIADIETRVFLKVEPKNWLFRLGPMKHSKIDFDKFTCSKMPVVGLQHCLFSEMDETGTFQTVTLIDGTIIRKFSITTTKQEIVTSLLKQIESKTGETIKRLPANKQDMKSQEFKVGSETISILVTQSNVGDRASLLLSVSW